MLPIPILTRAPHFKKVLLSHRSIMVFFINTSATTFSYDDYNACLVRCVSTVSFPWSVMAATRIRSPRDSLERKLRN